MQTYPDFEHKFNLLLRRHLDLLAKTEIKPLGTDLKVKEEVQNLLKELRNFIIESRGKINDRIRSKVATYEEVWLRKAKKHGISLE